ncbi:Uncharacterized protein BP5553_04063 [Venustampulla echinocandica]|uniref:VWFA domain-containing protein n=1 Tax=Venustampulla echinocandica TaxID=2656787 RepID=A0A370TW14_9HELO|nr:Uncharacterized protein BP5553_04063 [Venustampulla echinocandica]RDL39723.1 Uncharacterized protein BP5553_04063 [Venustampulla echinocandica]
MSESDAMHPTPTRQSHSLFGSIRKLGRKNSKSSQRSDTSMSRDLDSTPSFRGPTDSSVSPSGARDRIAAPRRTPSPLANPSPATRRPDRPGMNAFTVPSNEPPPAYTPSPTVGSGPALATELEASQPNAPSSSGEDPYSFLSTFDTTLLIDDSGSMAGRSWREVSQALSTIAPIVTAHDNDGIDVYFMNHKSSDVGAPSDGIASGGYRGIKRAATVTEIFATVRPQGGTPTGTRVHNILKPYLAKLEKDTEEGKEVKPLNLIVLTDGVPSDDVESVLVSAAKKLDKLDAPPFQVGVQFFQVGNEQGAKEALEELDDELCNLVEGGVRDIVDTVTWTGGASSSEGGVGLTGESIMKVLLGSVVKRLDRRPASGSARRQR